MTITNQILLGLVAGSVLGLPVAKRISGESWALCASVLALIDGVFLLVFGILTAAVK